MRWKLESGKKKIVKRVQRYSKSSKEKSIGKTLSQISGIWKVGRGKQLKVKKFKDIGNTPSQLSRQWEEEIS